MSSQRKYRSPELREKVIALARQGTRPARIAILLGEDHDWVRAHISRSRAQDPTIPYASNALKTDNDTRVVVPGELVALLRQASHARNIHPKTCAGRILRQVLRDNLIDAILDDGVTTPDLGKEQVHD